VTNSAALSKEMYFYLWPEAKLQCHGNVR